MIQPILGIALNAFALNHCEQTENLQHLINLEQVGIVSWGLKDVQTADAVPDERDRDFHTNLFSPEVQTFLKQYLGDDNRGEHLSFLE